MTKRVIISEQTTIFEFLTFKMMFFFWYHTYEYTQSSYKSSFVAPSLITALVHHIIIKHDKNVYTQTIHKVMAKLTPK